MLPRVLVDVSIFMVFKKVLVKKNFAKKHFYYEAFAKKNFVTYHFLVIKIFIKNPRQLSHFWRTKCFF